MTVSELMRLLENQMDIYDAPVIMKTSAGEVEVKHVTVVKQLDEYTVEIQLEGSYDGS